MDNEGIDVAVCFPTRGLYALTMPNLDPDLARALARAYNDWLHEFCQADPARLFGAAMLSPYRVEDAVEEARRCVQDLGFKSVFLRPNEVNNRNWHDPYYDPLWKAIVELDTRLGFHEGRGSQWKQIGDQFSNAMLEHIVCHPLEQMVAMTSMITGGILARHPKLIVAFLEANCSWLPFMLWRLDEHWEREGDVSCPELSKAPSEYFKAQCYASVECDEAPVKYTIAALGDDQLVFSTDFPHIDAKYPHATDAFMELELSDASRKKILWDNCARYYGFPN
jgi:predicted TIM-barrel fold metal-dependent hydrolase